MGIFEVILGDLVVSFIMHTFGEELGKRISPSPKWAGFTYPTLGENLFGCFQPYVAEKAASQRGKGRFPTFGENLWDSPGEKSGENSGKDFWGIKNGCGKPLGKGIFPETPKVVNSMRATKGIPF